MSSQGTCAWCGGPIPPRPDPRGRRAKYCSDACRAAASRQRAQERHAAEVEEARSQIAMELRTPEAILDEVVQELKAAAKTIRDRGEVSAGLSPMVAAAQELTDATKRQIESNRPRRQRRRAVRKSGR